MACIGLCVVHKAVALVVSGVCLPTVRTTKRHVHHDWHGILCRGRGSSTDGQAEKKAYGVHLRAPYRLRSADDLQYPFSNYVRGYTGLLDYVWYEPEQLEVQVSPTICYLALTLYT